MLAHNKNGTPVWRHRQQGNKMVQEQGFTPHGRGFLKAFLVEFGLYGLVVLLTAWRGGSVILALVGCLLTFAVLRLMMVLGNVIPTWQARSPIAPEHAVSVTGMLAMVWREWQAAVLTYPFLFAFEPWLMPNNPRRGLRHRGAPIVLVPGFFTNRGYLWFWRHWLRQNGYGQVYALSPTPVFAGVEHNAEHLARFVDEVLADTGASRVILIGHSMGGLVIRLYLHRYGGLGKTELAIAVGSPLRGTILAQGKEKLGPIIAQLTSRNDWAEAFTAEVEQAPCPVPFVALWSPQDTIVAPQHNSCVAPHYGRNLVLPGVGHMEMVSSWTLGEALIELLDEHNTPVRA